MLDFILGLIIGRSNPNQCFTNKKYNKYLKEQEQIKREAFRRREEEERKKREEALKRTCTVPAFYCDENISVILRSLTLNSYLYDDAKKTIEKGLGYNFTIVIDEPVHEVTNWEAEYFCEERKVFENRSLDKTVKKFIELCNSDKHYYRVRMRFEIKYLGQETSYWVMSWREKDREVVLNSTPLLLSYMLSWKQNKGGKQK